MKCTMKLSFSSVSQGHETSYVQKPFQFLDRPPKDPKDVLEKEETSSGTKELIYHQNGSRQREVIDYYYWL